MIGDATANWHWTIVESSGRWYRAVCRYVAGAALRPLTLQLRSQPLATATVSSLSDCEPKPQVVLWELDAQLSDSWSAEQFGRVQIDLRRLKQQDPQIKQIVTLRLDQALLAPMWYDTGADAVLTQFTSLSSLAKKLKVDQAPRR